LAVDESMACQEPAQAASEPQLQRKAGVDCDSQENR